MRRPLTAALAACALALAACGDDGLSTEEYREQARQICVESDRVTESIESPTRSTPDAIADYLGRLLEANERTTARFGELDPPEELQEPHDEILRANEEGARTVREIIGDLEGGKDPREVLTGATTRLRELAERSNEAARRLGVRECVQ